MREVKEETGLEVGKVRFLTATNDVFAAAADGNKHYVTIFVVCEVISGDGVPRVSLRRREREREGGKGISFFLVAKMTCFKT